VEWTHEAERERGELYPGVYKKTLWQGANGAIQDVPSPRLRLEVCGPFKEQDASVVRHGCLRKLGEGEAVPCTK